MNQLQTIPRFGIDYGADDFLAGVRTLFHSQPPSVTAWSRILGNRPSFWTSSGRQALWLLLRALDLPSGAGVALPLYCDRSVPEAVQRAGCTPVFVDVEEITMTMDPASLSRVRDQVAAVVVIHFFGHVADMQRLLDAAGPLPVIEDAAHAPFSFYRDQMAGTFGVACFYSFASTKPLPSGGGGSAVLNDSRLVQRMTELVAHLTPTTIGDRSWNLVAHAAKAVLFRRPFYGMFGRRMRRHVERRGLLEPVLNCTQIQPLQAAIALRQAQRLKGMIAAQRRNGLRLLSLLRDIDGIVLPEEPPGCHYNCHLFPVLLSTAEEKMAVALHMLQRHVDTSQMYWDIVEQAFLIGYRGGCPVSESVAGRMLTLPNHADLSEQDMDYVAAAFREAVRSYRGAEARNLGRCKMETQVLSVAQGFSERPRAPSAALRGQ